MGGGGSLSLSLGKVGRKTKVIDRWIRLNGAMVKIGWTLPRGEEESLSG